MNLKMNGQKINFTIDTGSSINVISPSAFQSLQDVQLKGTNIKAFPFHSTTPVKMKGKFQITIESRKKMTVATIYVTADDGGCLLSSNTAQGLGLISLHLQTLQASKTRTKDHMEQVKVEDPKVKEILHQFSKRFTGLGKLKGKQIQLSIDQSVKPVAQQQRRVPFHLREKVEMELKNLESQDIIEKVPESEHTDWVSPIVVVPKKEGKIRICVDMRAANTAVKRIRHPIPTVKDIAHAAVPQAMTLAEIQEAKQEDATLRVLRAAIKTGVWTSDRLTPYKQIKHEITVDHTNKILLRGTQIILPASLREHAIKLAHQGHQGQSKTTALLREYFWFPNRGQSVKSYID